MAGDVLDRLLSSTLARIGSDGAAQDTLLDRLMQRELELLHSIWDGRRAPYLCRAHARTDCIHFPAAHRHAMQQSTTHGRRAANEVHA